MPHALQHHVAFQVAVKVVDEFEPVEVHQHQRKRTVRARGAFPFRGQRFHQETVGLHAGQTIGNGLFLRLLESQRIVQRAGEQIRQGAEQTYFVFGEFAPLGGLHVQHAQQ